MQPPDVIEQLVSRETLEKFKIYHQLLLKWQKTINLVSDTTVSDAWQRHFLDSMQLFPHIGTVKGSVVDMGSGAGFPGLVLAIMGVPEVTLIESDKRKCAFLREVARETKTAVEVKAERLENIEIQNAGLVVARALAPLEELLAHAVRFLSVDGKCLFLKGKKWDEELSTAGKRYSFTVNSYESKTDNLGKILEIKNIKLT